MGDETRALTQAEFMGRMIAGQETLTLRVGDLHTDVKEMRQEKADDDVENESRFTIIEGKVERTGKVWGSVAGIFGSVATAVLIYVLVG